MHVYYLFGINTAIMSRIYVFKYGKNQRKRSHICVSRQFRIELFVEPQTEHRYIQAKCNQREKLYDRSGKSREKKKIEIFFRKRKEEIPNEDNLICL